jgi:hypothetical protein
LRCEVHGRLRAAVFLADAILDTLHFTYRQWVSAVDVLPAATTATRIRLLDEAARDSSLVLAYHVEGLGHVERGRGDYRFSE